MVKQIINFNLFTMRNFIQIALIVGLSVLLLNQCKETTQLKKSNKLNQIALLDSVSYYQNKLGLEVAEKRTFIGSNKELKTLLEVKKKESKQFKEAAKKWKKLYQATQIEVEIKNDSVDIPFDVPVNYIFSKNFYKKTELYEFSGVVNQNGIILNSIQNRTISIFTGLKRKSLFSEFKTEITSSDVDTRITNFDNFTFREKPKRFGLSFFGGYALTTNFQFQPIIGIGVSYDLLRF